MVYVCMCGVDLHAAEHQGLSLLLCAQHRHNKDWLQGSDPLWLSVSRSGCCFQSQGEHADRSAVWTVWCSYGQPLVATCWTAGLQLVMSVLTNLFFFGLFSVKCLQTLEALGWKYSHSQCFPARVNLNENKLKVGTVLPPLILPKANCKYRRVFTHTKFACKNNINKYINFCGLLIQFFWQIYAAVVYSI